MWSSAEYSSAGSEYPDNYVPMTKFGYKKMEFEDELAGKMYDKVCKMRILGDIAQQMSMDSYPYNIARRATEGIEKFNSMMSGEDLTDGAYIRNGGEEFWTGSWFGCNGYSDRAKTRTIEEAYTEFLIDVKIESEPYLTAILGYIAGAKKRFVNYPLSDKLAEDLFIMAEQSPKEAEMGELFAKHENWMGIAFAMVAGLDDSEKASVVGTGTFLERLHNMAYVYEEDTPDIGFIDYRKIMKSWFDTVMSKDMVADVMMEDGTIVHAPLRFDENGELSEVTEALGSFVMLESGLMVDETGETYAKEREMAAKRSGEAGAAKGKAGTEGDDDNDDFFVDAKEMAEGLSNAFKSAKGIFGGKSEEQEVGKKAATAVHSDIEESEDVGKGRDADSGELKEEEEGNNGE